MSTAAPLASPSYLSPFPSNISKQSSDLLKSIESSFDISTSKLNEITQQFLWEFKEGLTKSISKENVDTFLPMIGTFLSETPDGSEKGTFLALDLGGTNLRVCEVTLHGSHKFTIRQQKYKVSEALKTGEATDLFDYIAESVDHFLTIMGTTTGDENDDDKIHLGFTFSFPVQQTALDSGTLITWTKGFSAKNAVGQDVVKLLQDALDRKHIHVVCSALVNDTCGTLMARSYQSGKSLIGAIFGTGTNGAYVEDLGKMKRFVNAVGIKDKKSVPKTMIVNTEWGAFDNERRILPVTPFDNKLDRESINPRKQAFEKMISGMYLGEIARNVLLYLIDSLVLFKGHSSKLLNTHYGLDSSILSKLESTPASQLTSLEPIKKIIKEDLGIPIQHISDSDCWTVIRVSEIVGTRCARLSACAVAAVVIQTEKDKNDNEEINVGVDGSLVEFYPGFEDRVRKALKEVLGDEVEKRIVIGMAKDGSGVGAALCALQAKKQRELGLTLQL